MDNGSAQRCKPTVHVRIYELHLKEAIGIFLRAGTALKVRREERIDHYIRRRLHSDYFEW